MRTIAASAAALLVAVLGASSASAAGWPQFGYSAAHTSFNSSERMLSPTNVAKLERACTADATTWTRVPLVVSGGRIFVTVQGPVSIQAVDAASCQLLWRTPFLGPIDSAPAVVGDTVYVNTWSFGFDGNSGFLRALDAATGDIRWSAPTQGAPMEAPPAVAGGRVFVGTDIGVLHAFDAATGAQLWHRTSMNAAPSGRGAYLAPAVANGIVYAAGGTTVRAFQASNGRQMWTHPLRGARVPPMVRDGRVYVVDSSNIYALDAGSGAELWRHPTQPPSTIDGQTVYAPATAYGRTYIKDSAGVTALDPATGASVWSTPLPGGAWTSSERGSGPVVANHVVYVNRADSDSLGSSIYAVDADTGERLWSWEAPSHVYQAPAVAGGSVFVDDFTSHAGVIKLSLAQA